MSEDKYSKYAELAKSEREGIDYQKVVVPRKGATVAVIAPHAGGIEPQTGPIARAIARDEFSLYLFRGCKGAMNHDLHITSHKFDEPECVKLAESHEVVIAIHGCQGKGPGVYLGGRDDRLLDEFASELRRVGISVERSGHHYPGTNPNNICNRGRSKAGVQFELSASFRKGSQVQTLVEAVRAVLFARQNGR